MKRLFYEIRNVTSVSRNQERNVCFKKAEMNICFKLSGMKCLSYEIRNKTFVLRNQEWNVSSICYVYIKYMVSHFLQSCTL